MRLFEAYEDEKDQWRWRLWAPDYRLLASSGEAYATQAEALSAAEAVRENAGDAFVSSTPGLGMRAARRLRALLGDVTPAPVRSGAGPARSGAAPARSGSTPTRSRSTFPTGRAVMRRVSTRPTGAATSARVHVH